MKRGILIFLFIFILAFSVNAFVVSVEDPGSPLSGTLDITITISGVGEEENVSSVSLYYRNVTEEVWYSIGSDSTENLTSYTISFDTTQFEDTDEGYLNATAINNSEGQEIVESTLRQIVIDNVAEANNPPTCTVADTNITIDEDSGAWTLDGNMSLAVNISCSDDDGDALTYTISSGGTGSYGVFTNPNNDVLVYTTSANQSGGIDVVTLSVSDGTASIMVSAKVSVTAVNDAPYLSSIIPNKTWNQDTTAEIDLDDYFSDIEGSSLNYSYTFTSSTPININVTIESDGDAVFTPESSWTGTEKLTFTAYDAVNASVTSNEVILTVGESNATANTAPSIDTYLPETDPTISVNGSQTFTITKSDPDGDSMNVTWYVDNVVREGEAGDSFTYTVNATGSFGIKVAVSDGQASDTNSWTLTVKSAVGTPTTTPPGDEGVEEEVSVCGDEVCDEDETTTSCCKDCGCPSDWTCNVQTNKCARERKAGNIILLIIIISLFVGGAGAGVYFYKKKQEKEIFGLAKTPFETPPKEEVSVKKEEAKQLKKEPVVKGTAKKPLKKAKTTNQVLLKKYIIYNLKKGKSFDQIKKELIKVGWNEEQIQDAYTAAQLDEAFS